MKRTLYYILLLFALVACEREIPYKGEYQDPKLVMEVGLLNNADWISGSVTSSDFFLDASYNPKERWLTDVSVSVQRGDGEKKTYTQGDSAFYMQKYSFRVRLDEPLRAGEEVRVWASHPDFPTAQGTDKVVTRPDVKFEECVWDSVKKECRVKLKFPDDLDCDGIIGVRGQFNFWVTPEKATGYEYTSQWIASFDKCFAALKNTYSRIYGFNSNYYDIFCRPEDVKGREVEVIMLAETYGPRATRAIDVNFYVTNYSDAAYRYRQSLLDYFGYQGIDDADLGAFVSDLFGFEETVQIYNNVEDGFGVVYSKATKQYQKIFNTN